MNPTASKAKRRCKECGRQYIPQQRVRDALKMVKEGMSPSAAALAAGISRQRLWQIMQK